VPSPETGNDNLASALPSVVYQIIAELGAATSNGATGRFLPKPGSFVPAIRPRAESSIRDVAQFLHGLSPLAADSA
jgi:hypothetical protein